MTFSICVREEFEDEAGEAHLRFGVAVTTRLAGVGTLCPFVNEHGAVATQSLVNVALGERGIGYLADGLRIEDALEALLNADEDKEHRQLHGVDATDTFVFSGPACKDWFGHLAGDGYTVAGNLLTGEDVLEATADAYEARRDEDAPLAFRLAEALAAGQSAGGDRRTDLPIQSAAVRVRTTVNREDLPFYNDVRVDASETPLVDLDHTLERARESFEMARARAEAADSEE